MSYADEIWQTVRDAEWKARYARGGDAHPIDVMRTSLNAIPPLTLKTEDGRFVKVEKAYIHKSGEWLYRLIPEDRP